MKKIRYIEPRTGNPVFRDPFMEEKLIISTLPNDETITRKAILINGHNFASVERPFAKFKSHNLRLERSNADVVKNFEHVFFTYSVRLERVELTFIL